MPINPELYATSVLATGALILMPGPIVTLVIANSLAYGTRTGVQTALGASTGNALLAAGGALGLVAIMGYLGDIFDVVRWLGATYLIYLGIKAWRAKPMTQDDTQPMRSRNAVMARLSGRHHQPKDTYILCRILSAICRPRAGSRPATGTFINHICCGCDCPGYPVLHTCGQASAPIAGPGTRPNHKPHNQHLLIGTGIGMAFERRGS